MAIRNQMIPSAIWNQTRGRLSVLVSERTERLARILATAEYTWGNSEQTRQCMNQPHPELRGLTPLDAASTELGARAVEEILNRLFFGIPA